MRVRSSRGSRAGRERQQIIQDTLRRIPFIPPVDTGAGTGIVPPWRAILASPMLPGPPGASSNIPGPPGNPGAPGAPGAAGAQGSPGIGVPGFDGKPGPMGFYIPAVKGDPGGVGPAGGIGLTGAAGSALPSLDWGRTFLSREPLMVPGNVGPQGNTGGQGLQGQAGGVVVPEWGRVFASREPLMIPGNEGPRGLQGTQGIVGTQGAPLASMDWGRIIRVEPVIPYTRKISGTKGFLLIGNGPEADPSFLSLITARLTADNAAIAAAVPTSVVAVTGLQQAVAIGEEWDIEWILDLANSIAADVFVFNILTNAGTLSGRYVVEGTNGVPNTGAGVVKWWSMPAGTITVASANAPGATGTIGLVVTVTIRARIKLTVSGGTVSVGVRAGTNAAASSGTATVKASSQMIANRIA